MEIEIWIFFTQKCFMPRLLRVLEEFWTSKFVVGHSGWIYVAEIKSNMEESMHVTGFQM